MDERNTQLVEALRKSLKQTEELRRKLKQADDSAHEPIAVVAMGCRTPGDVTNPDDYWSLLDRGADAIGPLPARWDADALYDPDPDAAGKIYTRWGGFLRGIEDFDAAFFGISPREAQAMDPQQRVVLEVAWEALESAGLCAGALEGSVTGVYLGATGSDYGAGSSSLDGCDAYTETGTLASVISGRLAYALGLRGPALTIDTACSSSLVALHLACAALRQRECDLAIAGGVQVMSTPARFVGLSRLHAMSLDGRCKSFAQAADGAGFSEGCGLLLLRRLSDAQRDGQRVLALIRGSAVNQDGRSQGLTAPNGPSQRRVVLAALSAAGLEPRDIDALEAHGTGTTLGDPIEAGALAEVFAATRPADSPLYLGSSKSNLGHTQAAAGVLGVQKMILALLHARLPRTLHADPPSSHIAWDQSGLALLHQARDWPAHAERVRRAGVSSFGISGTNAHVIVEEAGAQEASQAPAESGSLARRPLLISARDPEALRAQARRWSAWLQAQPQLSWEHVLRSAALQRTHFERRAAISAADAGEAGEALQALAEQRPHAALTVGKGRAR
ncbi:MAG TPA: beta-ketoacyl synthase N-terminal-like domain-containing protein, partial [Polyangiales bacterium]